MQGPGPKPSREAAERPLDGIGVFAWKLSLGTVVALAGVGLVLLLLPAGDRAPDVARGPAPDRTQASQSRPLASAPGRAPMPLPADAASGVARAIEARHASGELADAQRRFEPCRGGDVRRVAWIDDQQRVRKLTTFRGSGLVIEQWFDEAGSLREAVVSGTAGGRPWTRRLTVDAAGHDAVQETPRGGVPDEPPPPLVRSEPTAAFFAGAGCER